MKRLGILAVLALVAAVAGSGDASAQVLSSDSVVVTATNQGIFTFTIPQVTFDFGNVDASGAAIAGTGAGVTGGGRTGANDGGIYTAAAAATWTCSSAPQRTVKIYNNSSIVAGALAGDRLEIRIPAAGGGTSQGYKTFSTQTGTPAGDLVTGMTVRNGANSVNGQVDFRLTVLDTDATGGTTWTMVLTASGV